MFILLLTVDVCDDDFGLDAATCAKYWMTFLVFSVFPAPDSPVQRIDWSSRSEMWKNITVTAFLTQGSTSFCNCINMYFINTGTEQKGSIWTEKLKYVWYFYFISKLISIVVNLPDYTAHNLFMFRKVFGSVNILKFLR